MGKERRQNGSRLKPSFGQVLGYIQEGEPLNLDLPNRKASIYTASHWYLDDYPNAPEPISEAPLPHTTINPATAFETADEGYDGVPFPRPPRPSFLSCRTPTTEAWTRPRPGPAERRVEPTEAPEPSGIQAAETIIAGGAAGAAAASQSFAESRTFNARCESRGGRPHWARHQTKCPRHKSSAGLPKWNACCSTNISCACYGVHPGGILDGTPEGNKKRRSCFSRRAVRPSSFGLSS